MQNEVLAILVGGGPAPGINGVISSATIEAINEGMDVVGIVGGFKTLFEGKESDIVPLTIDEVTRIPTRGGSILRTSRDYPDNVQEKFRVMMATIGRLGIDYLLTIGGEGTLFMSNWICSEAQGRFRVVHVPKTIDNDIPLPGGLSTFGYETARHEGVRIVTNLMEDAKTTGRWYFITTMGRNAGHLALGIGKASGATITLIPEEFEKGTISIEHISDVLTGSIIKRLSMGKDHGVAILAEGMSEKIDFGSYGESTERDEMGRVRLSEVPLGEALKRISKKTLDACGLKVTIVDKNIGYELRAADPIPFDKDYTRNLGYGAVRFLKRGGTAATIISDAQDIQPIPFSDLMDPSGKSKVRKVDVHSLLYEVARKYMIRLEPDDLEGKQLRKLASITCLEPEEFQKRFAPSVL
jgi:ATP-dependent phosphofructokinase / diphosphate-dependent phosphofructokinase